MEAQLIHYLAPDEASRYYRTLHIHSPPVAMAFRQYAGGSRFVERGWLPVYTKRKVDGW